MDSSQTPVSRSNDGLEHENTLVPRGICLVFVQLRDDTTGQILANTDYTVRGEKHGTQLGGTTDKDGVLRHEFLRDDHYHLTSGAVTELIETYYMDEAAAYADTPWVLRLRSED